MVTVVAEIPGTSRDVFLLTAHYDTPSGATAGSPSHDDASGAALLLGLARALAERPLPYTVWLAFVDGDSSVAEDPDAASAEHFAGSAALAERLAGRGDLDRIRLAAFFKDVADTPLRIARDLHSHRAYREVFFESARDLGYEAVFGVDGRYVSGAAGHRAFLARDLRQVVAITGDASDLGRDEGTQETARDAAPGLKVVGEVTLEALDRIARRLQRLDRFAEAPVEAREGGSAPGSGQGAPPADRD